MGWESNTTSTGGGTIPFLDVTTAYSTASTVGNGSNCITNVQFGIISNCTSFYPNGFYSVYDTGVTYGSGGGGNRVGFHPDQVRLVRDDYDAVKASWKRRRAEVKARRLFKRVVGHKAYKLFRRRGYHEIVGATHRRYRLRPGRWVHVMKDDANKVEHQLCAHLEFGVPWFDTMVVQHLMLTSSKDTEKRFLKLANVHGVDGPYPIPEMDDAAREMNPREAA